MIEVRSIANPPAGTHWSYGPEHMRRVSAATARALCGMYPAPSVGYETIVAVAPDGFGGKKRLYVQNVGGDFYVASADTKIVDWPTAFGVTVKETRDGEAR